MEKKKCPKCNSEIYEGKANFCQHCGAKLKAVCECWIKKDNYNCGESSCPGYHLFLKEKLKPNGTLEQFASKVNNELT